MLLHGLLGSSRNWQTAGADLSAHFHVCALDLRNHGSSPHADDSGYEAMTGDVLEWMDARGLGRASVLGHSMGGKIAMRLACRHPERLERLVVVDVSPRAYTGERWRKEFAAMNAIDLAPLTSRAQAEKALEAAVPDWAFRKFLTTNLERKPGGGWGWIPNLPALSRSLAELARNALDPGSRFEGPTLFIAGGKSHFIMPSDHEAIFLHFPRARIERIPSAGHNPHMEAREEFVRLIAAFSGAPFPPSSP